MEAARGRLSFSTDPIANAAYWILILFGPLRRDDAYRCKASLTSQLQILILIAALEAMLSAEFRGAWLSAGFRGA